MSVVPVSVTERLDEAVFTKVQTTPMFDDANVGTVSAVRAARRYTAPLFDAATVMLVDAETSVRRDRTLLRKFPHISTGCVAGNVDHVDPPIEETACPFSDVRPPILVPEMSSPEALRMYDQLRSAFPDISTSVRAGFSDHCVGAPAAPVGPVPPVAPVLVANPGMPWRPCVP
jgi:hypothetical protein